MHLSIPVAIVTDPANVYSNVYVDIDSTDDETAYASIRNRLGTTLFVASGSFENLDAGAWLIHTENGDVKIERDNTGCGCGGTSVTPRQDLQT